MRASSIFTLLGLSTLVAAHFELHFPEARGDFDEDNEPNFCDGYNSVDDDREEFPLTGGFVTLYAGHPSWTLGILVSTADDPSSFDNFSTVRPFASAEGQGTYCIPFDLGSDYTDGQNVTIQLQFSGGDGSLFQCADLTLSNNYTIDEKCSNSTSTGDDDDGDDGDEDTDSDNSDSDNADDSNSDRATVVAAPLSLLAAATLALWGMSTL